MRGVREDAARAHQRESCLAGKPDASLGGGARGLAVDHQRGGLIARHAGDGWGNAHDRVRGYRRGDRSRGSVESNALVHTKTFVVTARYGRNDSRTWVEFAEASISRIDPTKSGSATDMCRFFSAFRFPPSRSGERESPGRQSGDARGAGGGHAAPVPEHSPPAGRGHKEGHGDSMVRPPSNGTSRSER